jgi:hypothetical protein
MTTPLQHVEDEQSDLPTKRDVGHSHDGMANEKPLDLVVAVARVTFPSSV